VPKRRRKSSPGLLLALVCSACLNGNADPIVRLTTSTPSVGCDPTAPLVLYYRNAKVAANADQIDFLFKVANATGAAIPLSSLAVRYYFTNEVGATGQSAVYYAGTCCGAPRSGWNAYVAVSLNPMTPTPTADAYLETTFDAAAGTLQDGDAVQVEVGFHAAGFSQTLDQTNDYSYIAGAAGTQAEWDLCPSQCTKFHSCQMTVYRDGVLVWGTPP
jgi:hypothetical protein